MDSCSRFIWYRVLIHEFERSRNTSDRCLCLFILLKFAAAKARIGELNHLLLKNLAYNSYDRKVAKWEKYSGSQSWNREIAYLLVKVADAACKVEHAGNKSLQVSIDLVHKCLGVDRTHIVTWLTLHVQLFKLTKFGLK